MGGANLPGKRLLAIGPGLAPARDVALECLACDAEFGAQLCDLGFGPAHCCSGESAAWPASS